MAVYSTGGGPMGRVNLTAADLEIEPTNCPVEQPLAKAQAQRDSSDGVHREEHRRALRYARWAEAEAWREARECEQERATADGRRRPA